MIFVKSHFKFCSLIHFFNNISLSPSPSLSLSPSLYPPLSLYQYFSLSRQGAKGVAQMNKMERKPRTKKKRKIREKRRRGVGGGSGLQPILQPAYLQHEYFGKISQFKLGSFCNFGGYYAK